jgi:LysR family transcriptional regulator, transcriptional activator of nhaA
MEWLNYHHYLYFYLVAREGGLAKAGVILRLSPQAISGQIRQLEEQLGDKLFQKRGRRLELTEFGRLNYRIADEIFSLGQQAMQLARSGEFEHKAPLVMGVSDVVPKLLISSLLEPLRTSAERVRVVIHEDRFERLLGSLATHELDVVIADSTVSADRAGVRAFNHQIAESGIAFFAAPKLAARIKRGFPKSLNGAPMIVPTDDTSFGRQVRVWLDEQGLRPVIAAEVEDSALMKVLGRAGDGVFPAPSILASKVESEFAVKKVGEAPSLRWRYYAITAARRVRHQALQLLLAEAKERFS